MMKHLFLSLILLATTAVLSRANAQSLVNTNWKAYIGDPVNDTLVLHIRTDSSFVTDHTGATVVRSVWRVSGDTLTLDDFDGAYACPNTPGKYKLAQTGGQLVFTLIDDLCDGRAGNLPAAKWMKAPDSAKK
jgi:hypothetical protein